MNWVIYVATVLVVLGALAIIFGPSPSIDPRRKISYLGMLALGIGMLVFLVALVLTNAK